jgi:hypothetical protein
METNTGGGAEAGFSTNAQEPVFPAKEMKFAHSLGEAWGR